MNPSDRRDRDKILKMLRRKAPDMEAPIKKTTPELMGELTTSIRNEYDEGAESRNAQRDAFFNIDKKGE